MTWVVLFWFSQLSFWVLVWAFYQRGSTIKTLLHIQEAMAIGYDEIIESYQQEILTLTETANEWIVRYNDVSARLLITEAKCQAHDKLCIPTIEEIREQEKHTS